MVPGKSMTPDEHCKRRAQSLTGANLTGADDSAMALAITADLRVAFTFLVRDAEAYVERNVLALESVGTSFRECRLFYIENDSEDQTCTKLRNLSSQRLGSRLQGECLHNLSSLRSDMLW